MEIKWSKTLSNMSVGSKINKNYRFKNDLKCIDH